MSDKLNIDRMMDALSVILSNKYGCKVTLRATTKESADHLKNEPANR